MSLDSYYVFRPVEPLDIRDLYDLSQRAKGGLSNLPKSYDSFERLVSLSTGSFSNRFPIKQCVYIFSLSHFCNQKQSVVGMSGIKARTGVKRPYYSFYYHQETRYPYLELTRHSLGPSELGSLFLCPNHRDQGVGRLLSLGRFLFIYAFSQFFTSVIIAELRGFLYKNNVSPIWNMLGKKFIPMSFNQADLVSVHNVDFIEQYFPKHPIYLNLLSPLLLKYFKRVHPNTEPAKRLLLSEGFSVTNYVDIFDGGPVLSNVVSKIRTCSLLKQTTLSDYNFSGSNYLAPYFFQNCQNDSYLISSE